MAVFSNRGGDATELLELGEAAFDEVTLGVEVLVDGVLFRARGIVRDHCGGALGGDGLAEVVGVIGGVGHHHLGRETFDQWTCLRHVPSVAGGEREPYRAGPIPARPCGFWCSNRHESGQWPDLQTPLFSPRRVLVGANDGRVDDQVLEVRIIGHRLEDAPPHALAAEAPEDAVPLTKNFGEIPQGDPVRTIQSTPSTNIRLSRPVEPF